MLNHLLTNSKPTVNIFFDMDGVLAEYEPEAYQEIDNQRPAYIDKKKHYYLHVKPDEYMLALTQTLATKLRIQHKVKANLIPITRLHPTPHVGMYQKRDKEKWLKQYYPHLDPLCSCISFDKNNDSFRNTKAGTLESFYGKILSETDILIDDYNNELENWQIANGTAIKYLNRVNSADSWEGVYFNPNVAATHTIEWLMTLIEHITRFQEKY